MSVILSYPDRTLESTLNGGSWYSPSGLSSLLNLNSPIINLKARTTDAANASSIVNVDLGAAVAVQVVAIIAHNLSYGATIKLSGFSDSGHTTPVGDTGTINVFPQSIPSDVAADYTPNWIKYLSASITARYWKLEIFDSGNTDLYIEFGRLWIGTALNLNSKIEYGASIMYESRDLREESLGGVLWGVKKTPRRQMTGKIGNIKNDIKHRYLLMQKVLGTTGEYMFIMNDTASAEDMMIEAFPAVMKDISPLQYPYFDSNDVVISAQEIL